MNTELCIANQPRKTLAGGFQSYMNYVYSQPVLSEQTEKELLDKYHTKNDLDAVRKLVLSHLRFVAYIAKSYRGYGLPIEDLVQEGSIGLMKSVKRFDTSYDVRLATYAVHLIKAEIQEYVLKNWHLVKVATTKTQRKLFFNLRNLKQKLGWMSSVEVQEVAGYLNVSPDDVRHMELRMSGATSSIDDSSKEELDVDQLTHNESGQQNFCQNVLGDNPLSLVADEQFQARFIQNVVELVDSLDERSKYIVKNRWLVPDEMKLGLKDLSAKYSVSMERIRQIESKALKKIKEELIESGFSYSQ